MKKLLAPLLALLIAAALRGEETYIPVGVAVAGALRAGANEYLPLPLSLANLPRSLCLLEQPATLGPASPSALTPRFFKAEHHFKVTFALPPGTSLYGTGEVKGDLLRNGKEVQLWNTDSWGYNRDNGRRLYQSHPWILGVRPDGTAFGVIADSTYPCTIALDGAIAIVSDGPAFPVAVLEGATPKAVVERLGQMTGLMPLPPRWALGYQQCRWSYHPDTMVKAIADQFRARKIPCDVIWLDIHYMDGYRVFTFNPKEFPDPAGLNAYLHERGFKSVWMIDPGVKAEPGYAVYDSGTAQDVWVHDATGKPYVGSVWAGPSVFPDFTRPQTRAWWAGLYRDFMAKGGDGIWNDMNEPSIFKRDDRTMPQDNWHRGGGGLAPGPHTEYHNVYGRLMVEATRAGVQAANPDKRPFVLSRANFLGGQRFAATWTGDNLSTPEYMNEAIAMSLNLSLSGQPFSGPDLGGFSHQADPALWAEWVGFGAFFPFCRAHCDDQTFPKEPWAFGPATEATARMALERRYRLLPYLYTLFHQAAVDGRPVMQPAFFTDPTDPALRSVQTEFLLGDDLLVARRNQLCPPLKGTWRTLSLVDGDAQDRNQADLKVRAGAIIPIGKIVQSTTENSFDPLTLVVCPDATGSAQGVLYEDAGDGYGYQKSDYRLTRYTATTSGDSLTVRMTSAQGQRKTAHPQIVVQVLTDHGMVTGPGSEAEGITVRLR